jgi:hypothetical protein
MTTSWDINPLLPPDLGLQRSSQPAKTRARSITVIALAASTLACSDAISAMLPPASVSTPIIRVCPVQRASPPEERPTRRRPVNEREFSPDLAVGLSSGRLAGIFSSLFEPTDEPEVDVDYTFG